MSSPRKQVFIAAISAFVLGVAGIATASAQQDPRFPPMPAPQTQPPAVAPVAPGIPAPGMPGAYRPPVPYGAPMPYAGGPGPVARGPYGPGPGFGPGPGYGRGPGYGPGYGPGPGPFNGGFGDGPFGRGGPFGNVFRDGRMPFSDGGPARWFSQGDPEEGMAQMWEDMINAPADMGEMPGGWYWPEVALPNPVDVQKELRDSAPELAREIPDMININP